MGNVSVFRESSGALEALSCFHAEDRSAWRRWGRRIASHSGAMAARTHSSMRVCGSRFRPGSGPGIAREARAGGRRRPVQCHILFPETGIRWKLWGRLEA